MKHWPARCNLVHLQHRAIISFFLLLLFFSSLGDESVSLVECHMLTPVTVLYSSCSRLISVCRAGISLRAHCLQTGPLLNSPNEKHYCPEGQSDEYVQVTGQDAGHGGKGSGASHHSRPSTYHSFICMKSFGIITSSRMWRPGDRTLIKWVIQEVCVCVCFESHQI